MNPFIRHLSQEFNKNMVHLAGPSYKNKSYLVALSGGCDSMTLAHLAIQAGLIIRIAHCNYQLRGEESTLDESMISKYFDQKNIPLHVIRFDTKQIAKKSKQSVQIVARRLRYEWFEELCIQEKIDHILTGHHFDDSVETFILNLSRGSGPRGLKGIPEKHGRVLRPLLNMGKEVIRSFCQIMNIPFREDSSNADNKYKRNFVRNEVLPLLMSQFSSFKQSVGVTMDIMAQYYEFVNAKVKLELQNNIFNNAFGSKLFLEKIGDKSLIPFVVRAFLEEKGFTMSDIDDMDQALKIKKIGIRIIALDKSFAVSDREKIIYINKAIHVQPVEFDLAVGEIQIWNGRIIISKGYKDGLNSDQIRLPESLGGTLVSIRNKREGDRIRPLGMNGSKQKLQDIYTNAKLDYLDKLLQPLLVINDEIMWIMGVKRSEKYQVDVGEVGFILEWIRN